MRFQTASLDRSLHKFLFLVNSRSTGVSAFEPFALAGGGVLFQKNATRPIPANRSRSPIYMSETVEARLADLGVELPSPAAPAANYVPYVVSGNQLFISGQLPMGADGLEHVGKLGDELSVGDGKAAAKLCAINLLAQAKAATGDLEKVARLVKIVGFVNSAADFTQQPQVINGASDFLVEAMGDKGRHARSAVSAASLPFGAAVEIEAIFEIA